MILILTAMPPKKRLRTASHGSGSASHSVREERVNIINVQVVSLNGQCITTVDVPDTILGRDLWNMVLGKVQSRPGSQMVLSHNTKKLVLQHSLQQQGIPCGQVVLSCTYIPINLQDAWRFVVHRCMMPDQNSDDEYVFSLDGITEVRGISDACQTLMDNLPHTVQTLSFGDRYDDTIRHFPWPAALCSLTFGHDFDQPLCNVSWPQGLQSLSFGKMFAERVDNAIWPEGLQTIAFGDDFNQTLEDVSWPVGLQSMSFGKAFNQSLEHVKWPGGLQNLTFGSEFDQRLDNVDWPQGLKSLSLGAFNKDLIDVRWPEGLESVSFGALNQSLDGVKWPESLQHVRLGDRFDKDIEAAEWPPGLQSLHLGEDFKQCLDFVTWPNGLRSITLSDTFVETLDSLSSLEGLVDVTFLRHFQKHLFKFDTIFDLILPRGLSSLTFGRDFNQSLDGVVLPDLKTLTFGSTLGSTFNFPINRVELPESLETLNLGPAFCHHLYNTDFPEGLKTLILGHRFNQPLDEVNWPKLEHLALGFWFNQSLDEVEWPSTLQTLTFDSDSLFNQKIDKVAWPEGLHTLTFGWDFNQAVDKVTWPKSLRSLTFGGAFKQSLQRVEWPEGLESLTFEALSDRMLHKIVWPAGLQSLTVRTGPCPKLFEFDVVLPRSIRTLAIGDFALICANPDGGNASASRAGKTLAMSKAAQGAGAEIFAGLDVDGDGRIDKLELQRALQQVGVEASLDEVSDMMEVFDSDGDGTVDFREFWKALVTTWFPLVSGTHRPRSTSSRSSIQSIV
eukprot:symbB.v1.2.020839.t1/scaffold1711.1/size185425/2